MAGTSVSTKVSLGTVSTDWEICGAGDFNGDGKSDIVWQNILTGERTIWLMSGTTVSSKVSLGTISPDWQISSGGDFDGDGNSDLIWQSLSTGQCMLWTMTGTQFNGVVSLNSPRSLPPGWPAIDPKISHPIEQSVEIVGPNSVDGALAAPRCATSAQPTV